MYLPFLIFRIQLKLLCAVLSRSVMSDSLWPQGLEPTRLLCQWGFSRQEYYSGLPCPPPGDLPNPGIKLRPPALEIDYLLSELPEKSKNTGLGSLSLLQGNLPDPEIKLGSPALQVGSLPTELPGKYLPFLIFRIQIHLLYWLHYHPSICSLCFRNLLKIYLLLFPGLLLSNFRRLILICNSS